MHFNCSLCSYGLFCQASYVARSSRRAPLLLIRGAGKAPVSPTDLSYHKTCRHGTPKDQSFRGPVGVRVSHPVAEWSGHVQDRWSRTATTSTILGWGGTLPGFQVEFSKCSFSECSHHTVLPREKSCRMGPWRYVPCCRGTGRGELAYRVVKAKTRAFRRFRRPGRKSWPMVPHATKGLTEPGCHLVAFPSRMSEQGFTDGS